MRRHSRGNTGPPAERVALPLRRRLGNNLGAVGNIKGPVLLPVKDVGQAVGVHAERPGDLNVVRRHRRGKSRPAGEGVALFLGGRLGNDRGAVGHVNALVYLAVYHIDKLVDVDGERACYLHVVRRHRRGKSRPAGEGVALFLGGRLGNDRGAVGHVNALVYLAVHFVDKLVKRGLEGSLKGNVSCNRDCTCGIGHSVAPSCKTVAFVWDGRDHKLLPLRIASAGIIYRSPLGGRYHYVIVAADKNPERVGGKSHSCA